MAGKPDDAAESNEEVIPLAAGESEMEALPEESGEETGQFDVALDVDEDVSPEPIEGDVAADDITVVADATGTADKPEQIDVVEVDELAFETEDSLAEAVERPVEIIADEEQLTTPVSVAPESAGGAQDTTALPETADRGKAEAAGAGWRGRFGSVFGRSSGAETEAATGEAELGPERPAAASTTLLGIRGFFDPGMNGIDTRFLRYTGGAAVLLVLVLLLTNQAGGALILASAVVPILAIMLLTAHDVHERESNLLLAGVGVAGAAFGVLIGWIASWVTRGQWIDGGHLNFGAGGFGGRFADGAAPFLVWLVVGILLPAAMVAGLAAAPLLLRRWPQFANEVMDGMILAGASAAGLSIGLAAVFWWPMVLGDGPLMDVRDWTLTILGQTLLRPLVITLSGALIGAGVWRYMLKPDGSFLLLLPAAAGVLGVMVLWIGSLAVQPGGIWPEFLLVLALAVLVFAAYRRTLDLAVATDRAAVGATGERMVCPTCHQVTPVDAFCARCGSPLPDPVAAEG